MSIKRISLLVLSISGLTSTALGKRYTKDCSEMKTKWGSWKKNHTKVYDEYDEDQRNTIFVENVNKVLEYNENPNNTAKLEINHFADLTEEEFTAQYLGSAIPDKSSDDVEEEEEDEEESKRLLANLPSSVDWRTKGAVTSVKNQAHCGGCWAFAAIGALEGLHKIKTGKLQDFSEQQVINCDKQSSACVRGFHDRAFTYTASKGVQLETSNPFRGKSASCNYVASKATKVNKGHVNVKPKSLSGLMTALVNQPVAITLNGGVNAFRFYKSGVITGNCASGTSHAVLAVGYTTVNGKQAIIVKNSWGSGWGQKGYVYISTASANSGNGVCGILTRPSYPTA